MRILPVAVFFCLSASNQQHAEAFSPPVPKRRLSTMIFWLDNETLTVKKKAACHKSRVHQMEASKKQAKVEDTPLSKSEKIQEMASFLAIQLLGVAMKEISKEDGESKMSMEDMQRLTEALQGPLVETKQAQDKLETTWDAAGDAVEDLLGEKGVTTVPKRAQSKTEEKKIPKDDPAAADEKQELTVETSVDTKPVEAPARTTLEKPDVQPKTETETSKVTKSLPSPDGVRIPKVISAEFGKPLEVEVSNVNPLRHPLKRDASRSTESTAATPEIKQGKKEEAVVSKDKLKRSTTAAVNMVSSSTAKKQEQFQRNLLATRFKLEAHSKSHKEAPESDQTSNDPVSPELSTSSKKSVIVEEPTIEKSSASTVESSSQGESIEIIREFLSQPPSKPSPISIPKISESRLKSIIEARRQPKAYDEEAHVAERYAKMAVQDRAFAILFDLGMVEENKDPKDPSYDHSDDDDYCEHSNPSS
jgi:hypothetical protein